MKRGFCMATPPREIPFRPPLTVKHRGFFNFQDVISTFQNFFADNYYDTVTWSQYKFKVPSPAGAEYEVLLEATRKVNEYVKHKVHVNMRVFDMRDVEIVKEGRKIQTNDGKIHIEITPTLILDWQERFKRAGPFKKFVEWLDEFYRAHIVHYKIEDYWADNLLIEVGRLVKSLQATLGQEVV